jgi:hypothetical protein
MKMHRQITTALLSLISLIPAIPGSIHRLARNGLATQHEGDRQHAGELDPILGKLVTFFLLELVGHLHAEVGRQ